MKKQNLIAFETAKKFIEESSKNGQKVTIPYTAIIKDFNGSSVAARAITNKLRLDPGILAITKENGQISRYGSYEYQGIDPKEKINYGIQPNLFKDLTIEEFQYLEEKLIDLPYIVKYKCYVLVETFKYLIKDDGWSKENITSKKIIADFDLEQKELDELIKILLDAKILFRYFNSNVYALSFSSQKSKELDTEEKIYFDKFYKDSPDGQIDIGDPLREDFEILSEGNELLISINNNIAVLEQLQKRFVAERSLLKRLKIREKEISRQYTILRSLSERFNAVKEENDAFKQKMTDLQRKISANNKFIAEYNTRIDDNTNELMSVILNRINEYFNAPVFDKNTPAFTNKAKTDITLEISKFVESIKNFRIDEIK